VRPTCAQPIRSAGFREVLTSTPAEEENVKKLVSAAVLAALVVLAVAAFAAAAGSKQSKVTATLTAGKEVPAPTGVPAAARGTFTGTLVGRKLTWRLTFSHLSGPAGAAHIHVGAVGKAGNVLVPLCGPCKSPVHGKATLTAAAVKALGKHRLYVNVHTAKNAAGEIRGQLVRH
jgi:hypothetical protein